VLRVTCEHLNARLPSEDAGFGENVLRMQQAHTNMPPMPALRLDGRGLVAPWAALPPHRWTSRGRMRGVGATCTAPTTHGRPKRITAPEYGKIGAARAQRRRRSGQKRRLSPRRDRSLGVLTAARRDWPYWCDTMHRRLVRPARRRARSAGRAGDGHAPIIRQESEGAMPRRDRRRERAALVSAWAPVGPSVRAARTAWSAIGAAHTRCGPWENEAGGPAGVQLGATAQRSA
jgi:hypothetical protein